MSVSLHISGLILAVAGILFLIAALLSQRIYLYIAAATCIICGVLLMIPRRRKSGSGKYSA